jgi:hypothetical protein
MAEALPTPENSRPNRVASAARRSESIRLNRVANASHRWSEMVRRKKRRPLSAELRPRPSITTLDVMHWVGEAVGKAHNYVQQRRKAPYDPAHQMINRDRGAMPDVKKWRQLSKPFRRYLNRNIPR